MSFKRILHMVQDEMMEVENEMDKANYDKFRAQEHDYIMSEIKRWEDLHKKMIKEQKSQKRFFSACLFLKHGFPLPRTDHNALLHSFQ